VVSSDHLKPGETGRIKAEIDTAGKNGNLLKYLSIHSNDKANRVVSLTMSLRVGR